MMVSTFSGDLGAIVSDKTGEKTEMVGEGGAVQISMDAFHCFCALLHCFHCFKVDVCVFEGKDLLFEGILGGRPLVQFMFKGLLSFQGCQSG
jgi:hypothetical protein